MAPCIKFESIKNPALIAASGKNHKHGKTHGDNIAVYEKQEVVSLEK
jgi:hypothetical protein